jgi:hypothetical protein
MHFEQRATYILERHLSVEESLKPKPAVVERRAQPRANDALPARVWGVDVDNQPFGFDCLLDNMSASGLYLRLPRRLKFCSPVSLVVRLFKGSGENRAAAIKGTVIRDKAESDGHTGVAIRIVEHQFI